MITAILRISGAPRDFGIPGADVDSLVTGDMTKPEYRADSASNTRYADRAVDANGNRAVLLNAGGNAGSLAGGFYQTSFVLPAGITSATQEVTLSSALTTSTSFKLAFYDSGLTNIIASQRYTVDPGSPQVIPLPIQNLTPGGTYAVAICVNDQSQQAKLFVWNNAVRVPRSASGIFSAPFVRIRNDAALMCGTTLEAPYFQNWAPQHSRMADVVLATDATRMGAESFSTETLFFHDDPPRHGFMVNGRPRAFSPECRTGLTLVETDIPLAPGDPTIRNITLRTRASGLTGQYTWLRALYLPLACSARLAAQRSARTLVIMADSIATLYAIDNHWTSWAAALRRRYPGNVILLGGAGQDLFALSANIDDEATKIGRALPTDTLITLATNDYDAAHWGAVDFGACAARYVDGIHAASPHGRVWWMTPMHRTAPAGEGPNAGFLNTLSDYVGQIRTIMRAGTRAGWARDIDGFSLAFPQVPAVDGIHPNTDQHGQIADGLCSSMGL